MSSVSAALPVVGLTFGLAITAVWNAFLAFELSH
jgi:hypothetical protein